MHIVKIVISVFACLCFAGCTTTSTIRPSTEKTWSQAIEVGEDVTVVLNNGKSYEVKVVKLDPTSLTGTFADGKDYTFLAKNVAHVTVEKTSIAKTAGLVVGIVGTVIVVFYVLAGVGLRKALSKS